MIDRNYVKFNPEILTIEEKVGQLLMVHFQGESINEDSYYLVREAKVGGIIYYNWSNGLHSATQVKNLSDDLQNLATKSRVPIPLFIATDQEGGVVTRLKNGFTEFPGNKAVAMAGNLKSAEKVAYVMGRELLAVGINMNLSPVVDVNGNNKNPVIGVRSFGSDPQTVIDYGKQFLDGFKRAKIMTVLKHFPGHGCTETDSHANLPVVNKSFVALSEVEMLPFEKLQSLTDVIMTAHLLVPSLDPEKCSTLSSKTLKILRDKIGFQGVIMSDSLVMEGVLKSDQKVEDVAIEALKAGCDILLLGGRLLTGNSSVELNVKDIKHIHQSIVDAVKSDILLEERIHKSVERVLNLKNKYFGQDIEVREIDEDGMLATIDSSELAKEIAKNAIRVINLETFNETKICDKNVLIVAPKHLKSSINQTSLGIIGKRTDSWFFDENSGSEEIELVKHLSRRAEVLLICSYQSWKSPPQEQLIRDFLEMGKTSVLIVTRDEIDADIFREADLIIKTYSDSVDSLQAAHDLLLSL